MCDEAGFAFEPREFGPEKIVKARPFTRGRDAICSPKCSPRAIPPSIKKGTSIPISAASSFKSFEESPRSRSSFRPLRVVAAFDEPPPKPWETGMCFSMVIVILGFCKFTGWPAATWRPLQVRDV